MPEENAHLALSNKETLERFLAFLEVDIEDDDKELFIRNLLNSSKEDGGKDFIDGFQFTKHELNEFIHNDYEDIWQKQHAGEAGPPSKFDLGARIKLHQEYTQHLAELQQNNPDAQMALHDSMLSHRIQQGKNLEGIDESTQKKAFYNNTKAHYQQQFQALNNLYVSVQAIEGEAFLDSSTPLKISNVDYRRWADEQAHHEMKATDHSDNFFRINGQDLGHSDAVETRSLQMRIGLTAVSVALATAAVFSGDPSSISSSATTATGQATESCDTLTSLVNAVLFSRNKQSGLAALNLGIGMGRLTSQALAISVLIAPALFTATAAASFTFLTPICSLAMVGLYQYRAHQAEKRVATLGDTLEEVNNKIAKLPNVDHTKVEQNYNSCQTQINIQNSKIKEFTKQLDKHLKTLEANKLDYDKALKAPNNQSNIDIEKETLTKNLEKANRLKLAITTAEEKVHELKEKQALPREITKNPELYQLLKAKQTIEHLQETEKASIKDHKKNRDLWFQIASVTIAIAVTSVAIAAASVASLGVVPLALGVGFAAYSVGKEYFISGKHSKSQTLDDSSEHSGDFDYLRDNSTFVQQKTGIDIFERINDESQHKKIQGLSIYSYLEDLRSSAPEKAKAICSALKKMTHTEKDSTQYLQAKSELMHAVSMARSTSDIKTESSFFEKAKKTFAKPTSRHKGYLLFSALLKEDAVGLNYLKENKSTIMFEHTIDLNSKFDFNDGKTSSQTNLVDFLETLSHDKPAKAQAIITAIYEVINAEDDMEKNEAKQLLSTELATFTKDPHLINLGTIKVKDGMDDELTATESMVSDDSLNDGFTDPESITSDIEDELDMPQSLSTR